MNTAPPSRIFDCMHIDAVGVLDLKDYKIFFRKNHLNNPLPFFAKTQYITKNLTHSFIRSVREVFSFHTVF